MEKVLRTPLHTLAVGTNAAHFLEAEPNGLGRNRIRSNISVTVAEGRVRCTLCWFTFIDFFLGQKLISHNCRWQKLQTLLSLPHCQARFARPSANLRRFAKATVAHSCHLHSVIVSEHRARFPALLWIISRENFDLILWKQNIRKILKRFSKVKEKHCKTTSGDLMKTCKILTW